MRHLSILLLPLLLFAESHRLSSIPVPRTYVQNLDIYECNTWCLEELVEQGQIFSFLAHAPERLENAKLNEIRLAHVALFNLGSYRQDTLRIALLLPSKVIGRYANSTANAVFAYMLTKDFDYEIKAYEVEDESSSTLRSALRQIEKEGFYYVIAPVTKAGAEAIADEAPDLVVYLPTIHRSDIVSKTPSLSFFAPSIRDDETPKSLYFGGIDYHAQLDALVARSVSPLVIFYDKSRLGNELYEYAKEQYLAPPALPREASENEPSMFAAPNVSAPAYETVPKRVFSYAIGKETTNLEKQLKENEEIAYGSFLLNTPIIKSGMIMSQMTLYETNATNILSTQINYDPLLFTMTQYQDRKSMVIANSIGESSQELVESNRLLNNDIVYDWINYTTSVGIDLFFNMITNSPRAYNLPVYENQVQYPVELVMPSVYRFITYTPPAEPFAPPAR